MSTARELTGRLAALLAREHAALGDFVVALAAFDQRRHWAELGHASLFYFLHRELGLSKGAAYYRKVAAELVQRFPEVIEPLRDGRLCLTSVIELAKVLTPENRGDVLPRFFHRSKREAAVVAAEIRPAEAAPHRTVVTAVRAETLPARLDHSATLNAPDLRQAAVHPDEPLSLPGASAPAAGAPIPVAATAPAPASAPTCPRPNATSSRRDTVESLTAELSRLHVTVSRRFLAKLEAARDALSHSHPGASEEELLEAGLDLLLDRAAKRKGLVEKPRKEPPPSASGDVSAHVKRAAWLRAGGRCEWRLDSGGVCGSTYQLELDHHPIPRAHGGPPTLDNIRVHCKAHNLEGARRIFGDACMDTYARLGRGNARPPDARVSSLVPSG
jgi:hypothetical protein